jgi:hypothetical protein
MANGSTISRPIKDVIDVNSGRFEFLKQTLTLASAGIAGVAALFTDPTRVPTDTLSKFAIFGAAIGLAIVVAFSIMGLSTYANLLTVTGSDDPEKQKNAPLYTAGVRNHARVVILGLTFAFFGIGLFSCHRLFFASTMTTPQMAVEAASALVTKVTNQPVSGLDFTRLEADNDAYTIIFSLKTINSEASVRLSKKDGSLIRLTQAKKP